MINAILEVKANAEKELIYAQAKLDIANEILAKVTPTPDEVATDPTDEDVEVCDDELNSI